MAEVASDGHHQVILGMGSPGLAEESLDHQDEAGLHVA